MPSSENIRRQAFQPVLHKSFVSWSLPRLWPAKNSWGRGDTSDDYLGQGRDCMEDARKFATRTVNAPTSFLVMHISLPSLNARRHVLSFLRLLLFRHILKQSACEFPPEEHL